jgi:DNA (cytosine-5)-methyltransferase 1/DNA (cytosine-5)-methyltransferase 3A
LERANIPVDKYYASEIDKYAITIAQKNYPNTIQLGDITKWQDWNIDFASIDIVTAGFPCQAWSVAGKQLGDKDERGALFWTTLDIISHIKKLNPKVIFLLENVKMKREFEEYITFHTEQSLGKVNKYLINSALISAQNRKRYYWTNIDNVQQPEDKGLLLKDIIDGQYCFKDKAQTILATIYKENAKSMVKRNKFGLLVNDKKSDFILKLASLPYSVRKAVVKKIIELPEDVQIKVLPNQFIYTNHLGQNGTLYKDKSATLVTACSAHVVTEDMQIRKLTPVECERLQTLPDNYTEGISTTQRYKCLGNGWTVDVIAHIFKNIT